MADLNKVMLIWRITNDLELKKVGETWTSVINFTLATNRVYKNKNGERIEESEFHRCVAYWQLADIISQYLSKWRKIFTEWRLRTRQWEDANGNKRYTTEIVVTDVKFCDSNKGTGAENSVEEEDVPF